MLITARSYLTAGVAVVGAGAIALTPIQALPDHAVSAAPQHAVESLAVNLASSIDPITPWVDLIKTSINNINQLNAFYVEKPLPLAQTFITNQTTYFKEFFGGQAALIPGQVFGNIGKLFTAPFDQGKVNGQGKPVGEYISNAVSGTMVPALLPITQQTAFSLLPAVLGDAYTKLEPIINFTTSPASGVLGGLLGPFLAPGIAALQGFTAVGTFLKAGDVIGAINELINIPAKMTNAVLNGPGYLDLTKVFNAITPLPEYVKSIGLNLGGLLTPPVPITKTPAGQLAGGVLFDSLAASIDLPRGALFVGSPAAKVDATAFPLGTAGSAVGLGQFLSQKLLVVPPPTSSAASTAPKIAAALPAAAAAVEAPAAEPTIPAALSEAPAKAPAAVADTPAPAHRGGGNSSDNGGNSGGHGHRGAA